MYLGVLHISCGRSMSVTIPHLHHGQTSIHAQFQIFNHSFILQFSRRLDDSSGLVFISLSCRTVIRKSVVITMGVRVAESTECLFAYSRLTGLFFRDQGEIAL